MTTQKSATRRTPRVGVALIIALFVAAGTSSGQAQIPASHNIPLSGLQYVDILHPPDSDAPYANGCINCHGPYLGGGSAQSCFNCHWDYGLSGGRARPSRWTIPDFSPNTVPNNVDHDQPRGGHDHRSGGVQEMDFPFTYQCTDCHGPRLYGGTGPACYSCHTQKWNDPVTTATPPTRDDPPLNHSILLGQAGVRHKPGLETPFEPVPTGTYACSDCHGPNLDDGFAPSCASCHHRGLYGGIDHAVFPHGSRQEPVANCNGCHGTDLSGDLGPSCFACHGQLWPDPPPPNGPPAAQPGGPYAADPGEEIVFDGTASLDLDGNVVSWFWDFGDDATASGPTPTHAYTDPGTHQRYTVQLTVTDDDGATGTATTTAAIGWEGIPAPPVQQSIGTLDVASMSLVEPDCRVCHDSGVPDRHHLLYGMEREGAVAPFPDPSGVTTWTCLNCHDDSFTIIRDCLVCHTQSPHHSTPAALGRDCVSCHGDLVDNFDDGHSVPTYEPSLVTPARSGGSGLPANSRGTLAGGCDYCHADDGQQAPVVLSNQDLHHGTGLEDCSWCHDFALPFEQQIRVCEDCHGPDSLHNIQTDSPSAANPGAIVVGGEDAGYGHVGRDSGPGESDCWGCHGFALAGLPVSGPIVPTIRTSSAPRTRAGNESRVILAGAGFTNFTEGTRYDSTVLLTAADGTSVSLGPDELVQGLLTVTLPAATAPGNYRIRAVKREQASNPVVLSVVPDVWISQARELDGEITIQGCGFGGYAAGSPTTVSDSLSSLEGTVLSWSDTEIRARFRTSPARVTVRSVFGVDSADVLRFGDRELFRRGDANGDGELDMADAIRTLEYLFVGAPAPGCADATDCDDNGDLEIADPILLLGWLFLGGSEPTAPGPWECGVDESPDSLPGCHYDC